MTTINNGQENLDCFECIHRHQVSAASFTPGAARNDLQTRLQTINVCVRVPPVPVLMQVAPGQVSVISQFPPVDRGMFCHEFEDKADFDGENDDRSGA